MKKFADTLLPSYFQDINALEHEGLVIDLLRDPATPSDIIEHIICDNPLVDGLEEFWVSVKAKETFLQLLRREDLTERTVLDMLAYAEGHTFSYAINLSIFEGLAQRKSSSPAILTRIVNILGEQEPSLTITTLNNGSWRPLIPDILRTIYYHSNCPEDVKQQILEWTQTHGISSYITERNYT